MNRVMLHVTTRIINKGECSMW